MNNPLENPVAQGNPDELFCDDPEQEIRCPHCGAIWGLHTFQPDAFHDYQLYDWNDGKHTITTCDSSATPVHPRYCYACAYERASTNDLLEFVQENLEDFRAFMTGF